VAAGPGAGATLPCSTDLRRVRSTNPHIVWCALGAPKQELWMAREADRLAPAFVVGVGAAFDFLAETKRRAPLWMQQSGLEWLHRLLSEPRRLSGRYAQTNCEFALRTLADLPHLRRAAQ
jgi:N-acetylglucosaminyldiphosphoundecaprenol N-acetyl-beta-D-mannosaminyltransferase